MNAGGHCAKHERRGSIFAAVLAIGGRLLRSARRGLVQRLAICGLLIGAMTGLAHAVRPDEMLRDPALEARARDISRELRCLVCRNQSIDDSDADLAHDLRVLVRERLEAGDSDSEVVAYIRARYGDYVLLRPPLTVATVLLWGGPLLILLLGGLGAARFYQIRGRGESPTAPLTADERRRLDALLGDET